MQKSVQIYSRPANIRIIENIIDNISGEKNLSSDIYGKVLIATVEAVNNAIIHGNKSNEKKKVQVKFATLNNELKVEIKDEGEGFDHRNVPDPTTPENIENIHGRGVFIMKKLSDKISFKEKGRVVELIFKI